MPWSLVASGARGKSGQEHKMVNLPLCTTIPNNLQRQDVDPLGMVARCLRAEHGHRVDDLWKRGESGCHKYQFNPGATGLLHFLYRLRLKANYRDVEIFLADAEDWEISEFAQHLCFLTKLALINLEVITVRKIRKSTLLDLAKEYLGRNTLATELAKRVEMYEQIA